MAQPIQHDRYPKFVADQVLTEKSLNQMFGYLDEQQRLTRTTLIGIGIMCGMDVSINAGGTSLTISRGVGVTSKGYLIPFPESTYTFYNDEFSAEQEFLYEPFIDAGTGQQKFPLYLLHNNGAANVKKPITIDFLREKAVVVFVELLKIDNKNCDPDSCDDKGCTVEVTHRPLLVDREHLDELIFGGPDDSPFLHEPSCTEWPEIKMPRYNVPATFLLSSPAILNNFLKVLSSDFLSDIEQVLGAAYASFGYYIKDEYPNNPFSGLKNRFKFLFDGSISAQQLLHIQYYYDFFSDLISAYRELRQVCNECLSICSPNEHLFPRHLILGNAVSSEDEFRHHWIRSPAFSCAGCSEGHIKFLLKKTALLVAKIDIPKNILPDDKNSGNIKITPSRYGDLPLSDKAIPYYYDIVNPPNALYNNWNYQKTRLKKGDTNLSYDAANYNSNSYFNDPLSYDTEPYNFFRVEGHLGKNWKNALAEVNKIRYEKRLPIDVVALNGDIFELIRSLLTTKNSLADIISGKKDIKGELRCYFNDIESQYDTHAAELRCALLKVMAYFYNLKVFGSKDELKPTDKLPESAMVRKDYPNYRTFANSYGERFDAFYGTVKDDPYITPQAFMIRANLAATTGQSPWLNPVYMMYYLEKIYEALPDGLVQLQVNELTKRLNDASQLATYMLAALDKMSNFEMPALLEEHLDAVIRICKAQVFMVLYRNYLINYVLFISNQSFAMYAYKNPGVQHKAGVTSGGTFILVYSDKQEEKSASIITEIVRKAASAGKRIPGSDVNEMHEKTATTDVKVVHGEAGKLFGLAGEGGTSVKPGRNPALDIKADESVKGYGLNDIFRLVDGKRGEDRLMDKKLAELVNQFPDGTVIADFFVPNMCRSSCMPMNFIVMGDREPEPGETEIKLDVNPREFCEDDDTDYEITAAPEGGVLTIDGIAANTPVLNPTAFTVGNNPSKELIITYKINDDVKNIRVRIYRKPEVRIGIKSKDIKNRIVEFNNDTTFAGSYAWDFGNGQLSNQRDPSPISFSNSPTAIVTLKASNGPCENESEPLTVSFDEKPDGEHTCTPIDELAERFSLLHEISSDIFKDAIEGYAQFEAIFTDNFDDIIGLTRKEQCKLLTGEINVSLIQKTIKVLNNFITKQREERRPALLMYEILLKLVQFYACCQNRDVNAAKVKTAAILKLMDRQISSWKDKIGFNNGEKDILKRMLTAVKTEKEKTIAETPGKAVYIDLLNDLSEALSKLLP